MKILIIGSNSFSGSNFAKHSILKGFDVLGVSRSIEPNPAFLPYLWTKDKIKKKSSQIKNFQFFQIDINKDMEKLLNLISKHKPSHIINFAAQGMVAESWLNPIHWYKTNLISQVKFHDELRKFDFLEKYLQFTTPEVYGSTFKNWISEDTTFKPSTPYAVSRAACDLHLKSFFEAYQFPVIFTRAANVFGPGQQLYRIIPRTILSCLTGKFLYLQGDGLSERSFIHIEDTVKASLKLLLEGEPGTTWHISTKRVISIKNLVKLICEITNTNYQTIVKNSEERLGKDQTYFLDSSKIRNRFNWSDQISLESGISDTVRWVNKNMDLFSGISWDYIHKI